MATEIITKEDLEQFGEKLINQIKQIVTNKTSETPKWLKSYQVKNFLKISPNTLQKLRMDGTISYTKIGGILYYNYEDILKVLEGDKRKK